jgi:hypothetical protein
MSRDSKGIRLFDFSGGLNTNSPVTTLAPNQALDLQNIELLSSGGWRKRNGNSLFNASVMSSGQAVHGLGYYRQKGGSEWLMAIAGSKIYASSSLSGTMSDLTGAVSISAGQDNIWTYSQMNDYAIFVGGNRSVNVPIKYTGSGNAAALAGTPPVGEFGFLLNNYFFIGNTVANPSRIQWSILGNPEDWTGTGSGTQDVSTNDGDTLIGASTLGLDRALLFKNNSIHELIARTPPFPVFPKFRGTGAVSKRGIVNAGDMIYFVTPEPRMKATDGYKIYDFPDTINDVWDGLNKSRLTYIQGFFYPKLNQIWWVCSNGSATTNNYNIIWDINRKCWLRHTSGFGMNCVAMMQDRIPYGGAYDGFVYHLDAPSVSTDASESSAAINAYWRSGWTDFGQMIERKLIPYIELNLQAQTSGTFEFAYGFDLSADRTIDSLSMQVDSSLWDIALWDTAIWSGQTDKTILRYISGHGKFFQYLIRNRNNNEPFQFNGLEIPAKAGAPVSLARS